MGPQERFVASQSSTGLAWFRYGALLVALLLPLPAAATQVLRVTCASAASTGLGSASGLIVISGRCPATVDLSRRHIVGNLEFRDVSGLATLDLTGTVIDGSVTMVGVTFATLRLRHARIAGDVHIAEGPGPYDWIDNHDDPMCQCRRKYGSLQVEEIDAEGLSARSFGLYGVGAHRFSLRVATVDGLVAVRQARFGTDVTFHYLRALGLDLNSVQFPGSVQAAQVQLAGNLTLECSEVGKELNVWGARLGGQLHLEGTHFLGTDVSAFTANMQQLTLGSAEGVIERLRLERAHVPIVNLTNVVNACRRGPELRIVQTDGMEFDSVEGGLDEPFVAQFFARGQEHDPVLYRRLADSYSARGQHDAADEALIRQNPWLGRILWLGSSLVGLFSVIVLWLTPVGVWTARAWPAGASGWDRVVLAADLLLPDLVDLGGRSRWEGALKDVAGVSAFLLAVYRMLGWVIISVMIYVIIERGSY
jgi:hypothetical protein